MINYVPSGAWQQQSGILSLAGSTAENSLVGGCMEITNTGTVVSPTTMSLGGNGSLTMNSSGQALFGSGAGQGLIYQGIGNAITVSSGTLSVSGRISTSGAGGDNLNFTQNGGTVVVTTSGNASARSNFEIINSGSSFTMGGGSLILRNANGNAGVAEFSVATGSPTISITGGTIQFGDVGGPLSAVRMTYDVPSTASFANISVSNANATVSPFNSNENLRMDGNLAVNAGAFDSRFDENGNSTGGSSVVTMNGSNTITQNISGPGAINFDQLVMNRQGASTTGTVNLATSITTATLNFAENNGTTDPQIIRLSTTGLSLSVTSGTPTAISNVTFLTTSNRYVITTNNSFVCRTIGTVVGQYVFPIATNGTMGVGSYSPAVYSVLTGIGNPGQACVDVLQGSGAGAVHAQSTSLNTAGLSDYINRYWSVTTASALTIACQMQVRYPDNAGNIVGTETNIVGVGRYSTIQEQAGGAWSMVNVTNATANSSDGSIEYVNNTFASITIGTMTPAQLSGDWWIANYAAFVRTFYSLVNNANWSSTTAWTFNPDHTTGIANTIPSIQTDRVIIGNGHTMIADVSPSVLSVQVGNSPNSGTTTGTLRIGSGQSITGIGTFTLNAGSTLDLQNANGIQSGATNTGALQFADANRTFSTQANYIFSGGLAQMFGGAFPLISASVTVNKSGGTVVSADRSFTTATLTISSGTLQYENTASRTMNVTGNISVGSGGNYLVSTSVGTQIQHFVNIGGNLTNNGTVNLLPTGLSQSYGTILFATTGTQSVSGTGTTQLYDVRLDKGGTANTLNVLTNVTINNPNGNGISFPNGGGSWNQNSGTLTMTATGSFTQTIPNTGFLQLTGEGGLNLGTTNGGSLLLQGGGTVLFNTTGASVVGANNGDGLRYGGANNTLTISSGTITIPGGGVASTGGGSDAVNFVFNGGTVLLNTGQIYSSATQATFDLTSGSIFTASTNSTLAFRGSNQAACPTRSADFRMLGTANVSGGIVQFGDALTNANSIFGYNVNPNAVFWTFMASNATVRPFTVSEVLRLAGDVRAFTSNAVFDAWQTVCGTATNTSEAVVFNGANTSTQNINIAGTDNGAIRFNNLTMNRQGVGSAVVNVSTTPSMSTLGVVNLREGANANNQYLSLGTGVDLVVSNASLTSIQNGATNRMVITSLLSGSVSRVLNGAGAYIYPVGAFGTTGTLSYSPMTMTANAGTTGLLGVRVSTGANIGTRLGAHLQLKQLATDYLNRYWRVTTTSLIGQGQIVFSYPNNATDFVGVTTNTQIGRYRPNESVAEASGGGWFRETSGFIDNAQFGTRTNWDVSNFAGDWTLSNALRRIFYSIQSGAWNVPGNWSFFSHVGAPITTTEFPNDPLDSVQIGGGINGVNNHVISMTNATVQIGGITVGTDNNNTGTLNAQLGTLTGTYFVLASNSTLQIGSADGITTSPIALGSIQTTNRSYSNQANYTYNGTVNQVVGNGLPTIVNSLTIANTGINNNNTVSVTQANISITRNLFVTSGTLDARTFTLNNTTGTGSFSLQNNARLLIGGTNNFASATAGIVRNYGSGYTIGTTSTVEFYGTNQTIDAPPILVQDIGYGNIIARNAGTKLVNQAFRMRGNLSILNNALFSVTGGVNALRVGGVIYNNATIDNSGVIEICDCY